MPTALLTNLGKSLIRTAAGDGSQVAITHVALGSGLGANYVPNKNQTTLRSEFARRPIDRRSALGEDSWRSVCEFPPNTPGQMIREMGFFNDAGQLIAIWAGLDIEARVAGVITYIVDFILNFSDVDSGLLIVEAPDDELFDFAVVTLAAQADQSVHLFNMNERLNA
jgi:Phage tail-collar fibre protein